MSEFDRFHEVEKLYSPVTITEKIHGTNAQILIEENFESNPNFNGETDLTYGKAKTLVKAGSRERWVTPEDDNYGFARWVKENEADLIKYLGPGRHYGEWFGAGINNGYGLNKKWFALFNQKFVGQPLPERVVTVPILYRGTFTAEIVEQTMKALKESGSKVAPGFMNPEGVVIRWERNGMLLKRVFTPEESAWTGKIKKEKTHDGPQVDLNPFLQPIRLEKLLSKDERYLLQYPKSLPEIAKAYLADMEKEDQLKGVDEPTQKALRKHVFPWIKEMFKEKGLET